MECGVKPNTPPRPAIWILTLLGDKNGDAMVGDLIEESSLDRSSPMSSGWYWTQVCRSAVPLLWAGICRGRWLSALGAATGVSLVMLIATASTDVVLGRLFADWPVALWTLSFGTFVAEMMLGGFFVMRAGRGAGIIFAALVAIMTWAGVQAADPVVPLWHQWVAIVSGPAASLAGARLQTLNRRGVACV
jgi:hypothetical protein